METRPIPKLKNLIRASDLAAELGCTVSLFHQYARFGLLPYVIQNGKRFLDRRQALEFLVNRETRIQQAARRALAKQK